VGELEATQFSTTTKLKGIATFVLGANSFSGTNSNGTQNGTTPYTTAYNQANYGATTFNYDLKLNFDTSFTGKDLLRTTLRAGNFFGANGPNNAYGYGLSTLELPTNEYSGTGGSNVVVANRLFYNFPMGNELSLTAGALVRIDDAGMLGLWPSVYPADTVLDSFTYAGAPGVYNVNGLGGGAGFVYSPKWLKGLTISQNYVSTNSYSGNPGVGGGGVWTKGSGGVAISQIGYVGTKTPLIGGNYGLAFGYTYAQNTALPNGTPLALSYSNYGAGGTSANNYGLSGFWKPEKAGLVPSISWGFGGSTFNTGIQYSAAGSPNTVQGITTASWMIGLQWDDAFIKGNALGMGVGQSPFVTQAGSAAANTPRSTTAGNGYANGAFDSNYSWEWWYKFQVTDNISVTPAIYYISNYDGQYGILNRTSGAQNASDNLFGGLIKTTFKF